MNVGTIMEKSGAYVFSQRGRGEQIAVEHAQLLKPTIAISHETGAGTPRMAEELAEILQKMELFGGGVWAIFDRQLIERALLEQSWPTKLAEKIREEKRHFMDELMDDLFNLRPPSWVLIPQVVETALHLAMEGHVILVGHGATVITAKLPNVFHVRLTGSLPKRIHRVEKFWNLAPEEAAKFVRKEDHDREKFLKAHFHARLNNELLHDLAINTDRVSDTDTVAMIAEGARRFFLALSSSEPD